MSTRLALVAVLLLAACGTSSHATGIRPGDVAPSWTDPLSTGGRLAFSSLRGKPVYLNFFATWCPPCNDEAPWIEDLQRRYGTRGLHVVGIDMAESAPLAQRFRAKYHLTYPVVVDGGTLEQLYNINGLPVHVFIKRDGTIYRSVVGEMSKAEIQAAVRVIL
ncbi:MAG TPA: TlpA disulfide reductase family protein [Candidatus Dormibacteraeota bacterium]|nr:TlpA disulfide reductase family protein [Candidatus Dormibacteraeota bacterium]